MAKFHPRTLQGGSPVLSPAGGRTRPPSTGYLGKHFNPAFAEQRANGQVPKQSGSGPSGP
ncbi:hypothetical protein PtB15_5B473 [Puccinia triticina]|nr:hypothetical protein PtB15_5B473 [Puccinia triticina]